MGVVNVREDHLVLSLSQEVDTMHRPVMIDQVEEMFIKRRLARRLRPSDLEFLAKRLVPHLFPEEGDGTSHLEETHDHVVHGEHGFGLYEIGDVAIIVDSSGSESRSSAFPAESTDQGQAGLLLLVTRKTCR